MRSRTFPSKRDAQGFDAEVKAKKFREELLPRPGKLTLAGAYEEWWRLRASTLAASTQAGYRAVWDANIRGRHDQLRVSGLASDPQLVEEIVAEMRARGVGTGSQRKTLVVVSAVMTACVEWKRIPTNPVRGLRKPSATPRRNPRPFSPVVVERIRQAMIERDTKDPSGGRPVGDACLVSLMAYAGLRPQECLALRWEDIGEHTLSIDKAVSLGEEAPTKTRTSRSVPLVQPLSRDLDVWRRASGDVPDPSLVFPARDGGHWSPAHFNNWRNRVWKRAVREVAAADPNLASIASARPYGCRGSFISLQLRAGVGPLEVARSAGHSPRVMFAHYAGVIDELADAPRLSSEEQIINAREALATKPESEVKELLTEAMKPPREASPAAMALLWGPRRARR